MGNSELLSKFIVEGKQIEAVQLAEVMVEKKAFYPFSTGIERVFYIEGLFARFASLPQDKQEAMLEAMWPYVQQAMEHSDIDGVGCLLVATMSLGFSELAQKISEKIPDKYFGDISKIWYECEHLFAYFLRLPRAKQETMLRIVWSRALHRGSYKAMADLFGISVALGFTNLVEEFAKHLDLWMFAEGIARAFGDRRVLFAHFASLPQNVRENILEVLSPLVLQWDRKATGEAEVDALLSSAIALDLPELAQELAEKLVKWKTWKKLARSMRGVWFVSFALSSRERKEAMMELLLPYALQALENGEKSGTTYLLSSAMAYGLSDFVRHLVTELTRRKEGDVVADSIDWALDGKLFPSLPWHTQRELIMVALSALPYTEWRYFYSLLAFAIDSNSPKLIKGVAEGMVKNGDWRDISEGIAYALDSNRRFPNFPNRFFSLTREEQEPLMRVVLPYALQALEHGESSGAKYLLASSIGLGFREIAVELMKKMIKEKQWNAFSESVAMAFSLSGVRGKLFTSLPRESQEDMLWTVLHYYDREVMWHMFREWNEDKATRNILSVAINLGFPGVAEEVIREMKIARRDVSVYNGEEPREDHAREVVIDGIDDAFSVVPPYFNYLPRDVQEKVLSSVWNYARATVDGFAKAIALGWLDVVSQEMESLKREKSWWYISREVCKALKRDVDLFASLPRETQEEMLRILAPYALQASLHYEGYEKCDEGAIALLASAIALDFPDIALRVARRLARRGQWSALSEGISTVFDEDLPLWRHFSRLDHDRQLLMWGVMIPYAVRATTAEEGDSKGFLLLSSFYNPIGGTMWDWDKLFNGFEDLAGNSRRVEFRATLAFPQIDHLHDARRFTPAEYAKLVVRYVQVFGVTNELIDVVFQAVAKRPKLMKELVRLANEYPDELLPLIHELTSSQADLGL